jgi:mRNA-degrading endonuclease RelE of RelBE toxin-antitoxin system
VKFRLHKQIDKDLRKINDKKILRQFRNFLVELKEVLSINELSGIKKIKGERFYYGWDFWAVPFPLPSR